MKKKLKLEAIQGVKRSIEINKTVLSENWKYRYSDANLTKSYKDTLEISVELIHMWLFLLRAAEKQIPMPVKTEKMGFTAQSPNEVNDLIKTNYVMGVKYTCYNCGEWLTKTNLFCPHCGQKLWWPKN